MTGALVLYVLGFPLARRIALDGMSAPRVAAAKPWHRRAAMVVVCVIWPALGLAGLARLVARALVRA